MCTNDINYSSINIFLSLLIGIIAIAIAFEKRLEKSILLLGVLSAMLTLLYLILSAPDVAITEASVGAAMSSILMILALSHMNKKKENIWIKKLYWIYGFFFFLLFAGLCFLIKDMPLYQKLPPNSAAFYYNVHTKEEIGIANHVTAILASYRGYDTLAETMVIFIAGISVKMHLGQKISVSKEISTVKELFPLLHVKNTIIFLLPFLFLFAFFIQFYGEESPGGGFQSGILCASGFILLGLLYGAKTIEQIISLKLLAFLSSGGILLYGGLGLLCVIRGGAFLEYKMLFPKNPHVGETIGIMIIEIGVALTVFSTMVLFIIMFSKWKKNHVSY